MKKFIFSFIAIFAVLSFLNAQDKEITSPVSVIDSKTLLEVGVDIHKAIGNLDKLYNVGGGVNVGVNRRVTNHLAAVGRLSYTLLQGDKIYNQRQESKSLMRALAEVEVVKSPTGPVFGRATGGLVVAKTKSSDPEASFMYGATAGYRTKTSDRTLLNIGLSYHNFKFGENRFGYLSLRIFLDIAF